MARRKKRDSRRQPQAEEPSASLGDLMSGLGFAASDGSDPPAEEEVISTPDVDLTRQAKLVLRMERKGRGGKTVTLLSRIQASPDGLAQVARDLRRALGCGARVEGTDIVIQGDVRDRARAWLVKQGVTQIAG